MMTNLHACIHSKWNLFLGVLLGLLIALPATSAVAAETSEGSSESEKAGLQAASWFVTVPYGAVKVAYALGGGIVGGFVWLATGGNTEAARAVWIPSMTGDYIVQPQHLTGERTLHFVGGSFDESTPQRSARSHNSRGLSP